MPRDSAQAELLYGKACDNLHFGACMPFVAMEEYGPSRAGSAASRQDRIAPPDASRKIRPNRRLQQRECRRQPGNFRQAGSELFRSLVASRCWRLTVPVELLLRERAFQRTPGICAHSLANFTNCWMWMARSRSSSMPPLWLMPITFPSSASKGPPDIPSVIRMPTSIC